MSVFFFFEDYPEQISPGVFFKKIGVFERDMDDFQLPGYDGNYKVRTLASILKGKKKFFLSFDLFHENETKKEDWILYQLWGRNKTPCNCNLKPTVARTSNRLSLQKNKRYKVFLSCSDT